MTRATRVDTGKSVGCFPEETLAESLAKLIDPDLDGVPSGLKIVGKMSLPGDMERPVQKFHGREFEVTVTKGDASKVIKVKVSNA